MNKFIPYKDIKSNYQSSWHIPYEILLNTIEWRKFRQEIIDRDQKKCRICNCEQSEKIGINYFRKPTDEEISESLKEITFDPTVDSTFGFKRNPARIVGIKTNTPTILHVHHTYYIFGDLPWEYQHDALLTVCHGCHVKIHFEEKIPVYSDETCREVLKLTPCTRCSGTGFMEEYLYHQNGICFRCNGRKFEEFIT